MASRENVGLIRPGCRRRRTRPSIATGLALALILGSLSAAWAVPSETPLATDTTNGYVYGMARAGDLLYIGGAFTEVGGQPRSNLAAIDLTSGRVTGWNPGANRDVRSVAVDEDGEIYVGGKFSRIAGQRRVKVARISPQGQVSAWRPIVQQGLVLSVRPAGDRIYIGGRFGSVNGTAQAYLAALDTGTGALLAWNPRADGQVWDIELDEHGDVWVAGKYRSMGGQSRRGVAELSASSADATAFNPSVRVPAYDLALRSGRVYVAAGGAGGRVITYALDADSGSLLWEAQTDGDMQAVAASETVVYAGGHQTVVEGETRQSIAALDAGTGELLPWNPGVFGNKGVYRIITTEDALVIGGQFTRVGGVERPGFAVFAGTP